MSQTQEEEEEDDNDNDDDDNDNDNDNDDDDDDNDIQNVRTNERTNERANKHILSTYCDNAFPIHDPLRSKYGITTSIKGSVETSNFHCRISRKRRILGNFEFWRF